MSYRVYETSTFSYLQTGMNDKHAAQIVFVLMIVQETLDIPVFDNMERFCKDEINRESENGE